MGSDQIVKGKRTKRQRFGLAVTDSSSSTGYSGEESTEEEEDMANCLIMLAQGDSHRPSPKQIIQESSGVKAGLYVYECKTCNRSFPSFQALGGHRASHKKPKATLESEKKSSPSSIFVAAVVTIKDDFNKGNKIHECSICGSEFTSGQALGGHMRRHRAAAVANTNNNQLTTSNIGEVKPTRSILPLDLNLPAPEDDHHIGRFGTTHQSSSLVVFSAPALVDCHY